MSNMGISGETYVSHHIGILSYTQNPEKKKEKYYKPNTSNETIAQIKHVSAFVSSLGSNNSICPVLSLGRHLILQVSSAV